MIFHDRFDAARILANRLEHYRNDPHTVILAIPRGGLQTGYGLAKELILPLDIILTKKIGHPLNPEYAIGAVSLLGEVNQRYEPQGKPWTLNAVASHGESNPSQTP